jgi:transcriptional regulator with XRE-family HTH domain
MPPSRRKPPRGPELKALGETVKRLREKKGLTQEAFGSALYTDHKKAGEVERGQRNIQYLTLLQLASVLETTPDKLVRLALRLQAKEEAKEKKRGKSPRRNGALPDHPDRLSG